MIETPMTASVETRGCEIKACATNANVLDVTLPNDGVRMKTVVDKVERALILQALGRTNNSRTHAATLLGVNRTTLVEKMKRLGIA